MAWWQPMQSPVPPTAWSKPPGAAVAWAAPSTRSGRWDMWQAMQVVAATVAGPCVK